MPRAAFPAPAAHPLACPDCGATLRLALLPAAHEPRAETPFVAAPPALQSTVPERAEIPDFEESIRSHKRQLIAAALEENDGVMTRAAKALGLKYTTFVAMVHRLGVVVANDDEQVTD